MEQVRHDIVVAPAVQVAMAATQPYEAVIFMSEAAAAAWLQAPMA